MVWSLMLALALAATPALDDEGLEVVFEPVVVEDVQQGGSYDPPVEEESKGDTKEEGPKAAEREPEAQPGEDSKAAEDVEEVREEQQVEVATPEVEPSRALGDRASVTFSAYQSVSPTSQYATYATGLLKEVRLDEHYCFVQDSQQSYAFVVGTADSMGTFTAARWWRWYNAGTGLGWRVESGSGTAVVSPSSYVVLSDLEGYPSLPDSVHEVTRREVMTYALVAVAVYSLYHVWSFVIRMHRGGTE